jgi:hypothetical protein
MLQSDGNILSIVIVVKDNLLGYEKTMRSILAKAQNLTKFIELLIIDGSSNNDINISHNDFVTAISDVSKVRLKYYRLPANGVYNAMNLAIKKCQSDWVWFINSGDISIVDINEIAEKISIVSEQCNVLCGYVGKTFDSHKSFFVKEKNQIAHQGMIYRKKIHQKYGFYSEELRGASDIIFIKKLVPMEVQFEKITVAVCEVSPLNMSRQEKTLSYDFKIIRYISFKRYVIQKFVFLIEGKLGFSVTSYAKSLANWVLLQERHYYLERKIEPSN